MGDETNDKILRSVILYNSTLKLWNVNLLDGLLTKGKYNITINGLLVPGSNNNSNIQAVFIRKSDDTIVLYNTNATTASFPSLSEVVTQNISLIDYKYLLEGAKLELTFQVIMFSNDINSETIMYIYFPFYYAPGLVNTESDLFCKTGQYDINCTTSIMYPYRIEIKNFPVYYTIGSNFNLTVSGIVSPSSSLRSNLDYANETIFVAVDTWRNGTFSEMMHLTPPLVQTLASTLLLLKINSFSIDTLTSRSLSGHTIAFRVFNGSLSSDNGTIVLMFPSTYSSIKYLTSLSCSVIVGENTTAKTVLSSTCEVFGL